MRLKGKPRQVVDPTTNKLLWSLYPVTRAEAVREKIVKYWPMIPCPEHGDKSVHFTLTGIAACCAHHAAAAAYNHAVLVLGEPNNITDATNMGVNYYWSPECNPHCGHPGKKTFSGECVICKENQTRSPRQMAIEAGEDWYMPSEGNLCPNGHHARRRVTNGSCEECERKRRERQGLPEPTAKVYLHEAFPDMVISRADARAANMVMYRTGEPCKRGHTGWRYISTGGCIDCKKEW